MIQVSLALKMNKGICQRQIPLIVFSVSPDNEFDDKRAIE
jgi:hypothetical protein